MKVKECMCSNVTCVNPNTTVSDVAKIMMNNHVGCVPVCDETKNVVGLVTDRDLILRSIACDKDVKTTPVSEVMTTKIYNVSPDAEVAEASKVMCDCQIKRVPVVENDVLVGIITLGDIANKTPEKASQTIQGICHCGEHQKNAE